MSPYRYLGRVAVVAVLLLVTTSAAEAQSLGGLRRAVQERVGQEARGAAGATPAQSSTPARTAGFTADQLDRLAVGLSAEIASRTALAAELRGLQSRPDYEQCRLEFAMSDAGQKAFSVYNEAVMAYYADMQNRKRQDDMQAAQEKFEAATRKACGPGPDEADKVRREKMAQPERDGAEKAGLAQQRYAVLKELVFPYCQAADRFPAGRDAKIPSGAGQSYAYSAEDTALLQPRCGELLPLLQKTL